MEGLGYGTSSPTLLLSDSQGSIALAYNPTHHDRTKHIDIQYHFVRDHIHKGTIEVRHVSTENMAADILTKALDKQALERGMRLLGMTCNKEEEGK